MTWTPASFAFKTTSTWSCESCGFILRWQPVQRRMFGFQSDFLEFDSLFVLSGSIGAAVLVNRADARINKVYHKPEAAPNVTNYFVQRRTCGNDTLLFYYSLAPLFLAGDARRPQQIQPSPVASCLRFQSACL